MGAAVLIGVLVIFAIYYFFIRSEEKPIATTPPTVVNTPVVQAAVVAPVAPVAPEVTQPIVKVPADTVNSETIVAPPIVAPQAEPNPPGFVIQVGSNRNARFKGTNLCFQPNSSNQVQLQTCSANTPKYFLSSVGQLVDESDTSKCISAPRNQDILYISPCNTSDTKQQWTYDDKTNFGFYNKAIPTSQINVFNNEPRPDAMVDLWDNNPTQGALNQFIFGSYTPISANLA